MCAFLGLAGYYRHFISGFAAKARPLYILLREDSVWRWGETENEAFEVLKACLCADPVLRLPQPDRPYTLSTDYSAYAISSVLEQLQEDNKTHVIAYASRCCNDAESKYGSSMGEFLAVVFGVTKFHHYLAGSRFTIVTDNAALCYLEGHRQGSPKVSRWAMMLANYNCIIHYRPGHNNANADGLSRA